MSRTILLMLLVPFSAMDTVVLLLSMEGQKALGFHKKNNNNWVPKMKVLRVRNNMRVINDRIFFFGYYLILKLSL